MPTVTLTDIAVRTARPVAGKQVVYWDRGLANFGLRVGERSKTWIVMLGGTERRRLSIGRYPEVSLQAARAEARRLLATAAFGTRDVGPDAATFGEVLERFVEVHLRDKKASTATDWERVLRKHFEPIWKKRALKEISRADVAAVINRLLKDGGEANNAFAVIRVFFRWCVRRGYLSSNPMESLTLPVRRRARDRVLTNIELSAIMGALNLETSFGIIVLVLMLTAQRRGEIGNLRSEWVNEQTELITLPKEATKNGIEHAFPLTPLVLRMLPKRQGLLFPARGNSEKAFNGWSKSVAALRKSSGVDFRLHDLRRSAATMMASLGVQPYVIERILNHVTASTRESITPLARIYNRHRYLDEMRSALMLLEREILRLQPKLGCTPLCEAPLQPSLDL